MVSMKRLCYNETEQAPYRVQYSNNITLCGICYHPLQQGEHIACRWRFLIFCSSSFVARIARGEQEAIAMAYRGYIPHSGHLAH